MTVISFSAIARATDTALHCVTIANAAVAAIIAAASAASAFEFTTRGKIEASRYLAKSTFFRWATGEQRLCLIDTCYSNNSFSAATTVLRRMVYSPPAYCKSQYKTLIFETSSLRHLGSLGSLSEAISVYFGLVFQTENNPKTAPELI